MPKEPKPQKPVLRATGSDDVPLPSDGPVKRHLSFTAGVSMETGADSAGKAVEILVDTPFATLDQIDMGATMYEVPYMCYNCGDKTHGAKDCPKPLRGTKGNKFVPFGAQFTPAENLDRW